MSTPTRRIHGGWMAALLALAAALIPAAPALSSGDDDPAAVIEQLHGALMESMRAGAELDFEQRVERLRPVVDRSYHFAAIARLMLGPPWDELAPAQRDAVTAALARLSARRYARHFDRYNGERLRHDETNRRGERRAIVRTTLVKADGERIGLDYMLQREEGRWGVVNVIADGVSDLALKRAEYARLLEREGYPALIERLRERIDEIGPR